METKTINYKSFKATLSGLLTFDIREYTEEEKELFYQEQYINFRKSKMNFYDHPIEEWAEFFFQPLTIEAHGLCLASKLKGLKQIANKSGLKS